MQNNKDWLEFRLDGDLQDQISGNVSWQQQSYPVSGSGTHTLRWKYMKDSSGSGGSDCAWVDHVQWSGDLPDPNGWQEIAYTYDPAGRRIEKKVEGQTQVKYLYDGDHCIAEYDANDTLLRKYIHGPAVDEPICMIEVADSNATYYYHFGGLGSCIALSDADANAVQFYEYSVYGRVAASDPNHTNPFMFTGRRFDADTGLYYYRARYYNPYIGRFLQTDPIGYGDGMNLYRYCMNGPVGVRDPSGLDPCDPCDPCAPKAIGGYWTPSDAAIAATQYIMRQADHDPSALECEWSYWIYTYDDLAGVPKYGYTVPVQSSLRDRISEDAAYETADRIPLPASKYHLFASGHSHSYPRDPDEFAASENFSPDDLDVLEKRLRAQWQEKPGHVYCEVAYLSTPTGRLHELVGWTEGEHTSPEPLIRWFMTVYETEGVTPQRTPDEVPPPSPSKPRGRPR